MFAQLVITLVIVWALAEVLCRLILETSVAAAARELFTDPDVPEAEPRAAAAAVEPNASLRRLLGERRRKLAETKSRLELAVEAAEVAEQLARQEAELDDAEGRLAEAERRRAGR